MVNRIDLTKREDGYIVSTVKPTFMGTERITVDRRLMQKYIDDGTWKVVD